MTDEQQNSDFVRLLTTHQRQLCAYILSMVPHWNDAEEILQETNVRLWQEWEQFEPNSNFAAWAKKVAYYQVLTFRKSASRNRELASQEFVEAVAATFEQTDDQAAARQAALAACFAEQSEKNRDLIRRSYTPGVTITQIANHLGRSTAATYKALGRARELLGKCVRRRLREEDAL